ncbi:GNAT family N-acetyltransferase [Ferrovibrio terrae]|uniref:GNAT family N-acetyltransferase n=1 Tax=Ferrovibrio terrae TaxID=2594003 RepID=UPI003137D5B5
MTNGIAYHPLDNVIWSALTTLHVAFATGSGLARHYPRDMAPFSAIVESTPKAYADLAPGLMGHEARLFRPQKEPTPPGWETLSARPILQMVAERAPQQQAGDKAEILLLNPGDIPDMMALADIGKPGPFSNRTALLGQYVGIRDAANGSLIAMAGERFRCQDYIELSAICVHPAARNRGLGAILVRHLMAAAFERGEIPFLHVFPDNPAARLYERCGFHIRAQHWVIWRRPLPG